MHYACIGFNFKLCNVYGFFPFFDSLLNLPRNDQGRSKRVITPPLESTVLHFVGIQTLSNTLWIALVE